MSINAITAKTLTPHVTAYDARKIVYALGGPWPHRCKLGNGAENFQCSVNVEDSLYLDIAKGIVVFHGYVFSNDEVITQAMNRAGSSSYRKSTVYLKATTRLPYGYDALVLEVADSEVGSTADSVSYPALETPAYQDYIIDDELEPAAFYIPIAHVLIHGGTIEAVEDLLPLWDNKQFYAPGDIVDLSYNIFTGFLSSSNTNIYFFIPISKATSMITGAILSGNFAIRHPDGGYIGINGQPLEDLGNVTITPFETGVYVRVILSTPTALTNNVPISIQATPGAELTFY